MTSDSPEMPAFLRRETPAKPTRRAARKNSKERQFRPGVTVKRPTRAQYATLAKRDWSAAQVARLGRDEAATIIKLGVGPEARFTKIKKHQFPGDRDDG